MNSIKIDMSGVKEIHELKALVNHTYDIIIPVFDKKKQLNRDEMREVIRKLSMIDNVVFHLEQGKYPVIKRWEMKLYRVLKFAYRHTWGSNRMGFFKMLSVGMEVYA